MLLLFPVYTASCNSRSSTKGFLPLKTLEYARRFVDTEDYQVAATVNVQVISIIEARKLYEFISELGLCVEVRPIRSVPTRRVHFMELLFVLYGNPLIRLYSFLFLFYSVLSFHSIVIFALNYQL